MKPIWKYFTSGFALLLLSPTFLFAQEKTNNTNYFYSEDFTIQNIPLIISVAKKTNDSNNLVSYQFDISVPDSTKPQSFTLADINPNARTITAFKTNFEMIFKKIEGDFEKGFIDVSMEKIELDTVVANLDNSTSLLRADERIVMENLIDKAPQHLGYSSRKLEKYFADLDLAEEDKAWLSKEINIATAVSISNKKRVQEAIDDFTTKYLMNAYLASLKPDNEAQQVGKISANEAVPIHLLKHEKKEYQDKIDYLATVIIDAVGDKNINKPSIVNSLDSLDLNDLQLSILSSSEIKPLYSNIFSGQAVTTDKVQNILINNLPNMISNLENEILLEVERVYIEFESNQIKNIKVVGKMLDIEKHIKKTFTELGYINRFNDLGEINIAITDVVFQNRVPISYSTKRDISRDVFLLNKKNKDVRLFDNEDLFGIGVYINLSDVFDNDYNLLNYTENYSPKDGVVMISPGEEAKIIYKEKTLNLLQAKVFSDFVGLDADEPNGLIQTEISKRVYLNTSIRQMGKYYTYFGTLNSFYPRVTLSKLEENNRDLELQTITDPQFVVNDLNHYATTLQTYRFQNFSVGGELNLFYIGLPKLHMMIYANAGAHFGRTSVTYPFVSDSIDNRFNVNSLMWYPEIDINIQPHPSYRFSVDFKYTSFDILNDAVLQVNSPAPYFRNEGDTENRLGIIKFTAAVKPNNEIPGELFFRWTYNWTLGNIDQNFLQAQVGYSFNILRK